MIARVNNSRVDIGICPVCKLEGYVAHTDKGSICIHAYKWGRDHTLIPLRYCLLTPAPRLTILVETDTVIEEMGI